MFQIRSNFKMRSKKVKYQPLDLIIGSLIKLVVKK